MKVYVFPADAQGCGFYRAILPANVLIQRGHDVVVVPPRKESNFEIGVSVTPYGSEVVSHVKIPQDADVVVLQRPMNVLQSQMFRVLRANGIAVVVDMDDDMESIHPRNLAYHVYHRNQDKKISWRNGLSSCREATLVTASTKRLALKYAPHGRYEVLDNYVPEAYLDCTPQGFGTFGWPGSVSSHPDDLQVTGDAVRRLTSEGYAFRVVGDGKGVRQALRFDGEVSSTGSVPIRDWACTISRELEVGIVPLAPSAFNNSKSRLKGIELMAAGVPWVASPREEYRRLQREAGCGFLADTPKQWYQTIKRLLTDDALRKEQREAGRTYMRDQTYQANAWRWAAAWQRAYDIQRGVSK